MGLFFWGNAKMTIEPNNKRVYVFVDGQNLFYAIKDAFGYPYPNYDIQKLVHLICVQRNWQISKIRFYTGIPDALDNERWNSFWVSKLASMGRSGVEIFTRPLRYRDQTVNLNNGKTQTIRVGREKGIDVRIAVDIIRSVLRNECDVAIIFSQDQDLSEVADEIRMIAREHNRWIKMISAFPSSPTAKNTRGINRTDWIKIDRNTYDKCIDPNNYRP